MTGFGAGTSERKDVAVRVELRSVNHRHLLVKVRVPGELSHLEQEVEARVRKRLERGSVAVHVQLLRARGRTAFELDEDLARRYQLAAKRLAQHLELEGGLAPRDLLALPGVLVPVEDGRAASQARVVHAAVDLAVESLLEMRAEEGAHLAKAIERHARAAERARARIAKAMPSVVERHHATLRKRVAELLGRDAAVPENEVARELALLADRLDVSEELARLASHVVQLRALLGSQGAVGRKLDFLAQELFREANTIGAKCNDAAVAHLVVDLKTEIERLREQVQNVE